MEVFKFSNTHFTSFLNSNFWEQYGSFSRPGPALLRLLLVPLPSPTTRLRSALRDLAAHVVVLLVERMRQARDLARTACRLDLAKLGARNRYRFDGTLVKHTVRLHQLHAERGVRGKVQIGREVKLGFLVDVELNGKLNEGGLEEQASLEGDSGAGIKSVIVIWRP